MNDDQDKIYIDADEEEELEDRSGKKFLRVLAFRLGEENYCVDVRQAKEVVRMPDTTRVPNVPAFVIGVANLRGEILSLLDLHYFFGIEQKGSARAIRIIVTDVGGTKVGLMVDEVNDTIEIEEASIQEPLSTLRGKVAEFTKGQIPCGNDIYTLLDFEKLLKGDEIRNLRKGEGL